MGALDLALLYIPEAYSSAAPHGEIWGRQSTGEGFLRALAGARPERVLCFTHPPSEADAFRDALAWHGSPETEVSWVGLHDLPRLAEPGLLYRPDPSVGEDAWRRSAVASAEAWSICGVTHTMCGNGMTSTIAGWLTAPLQPWDAVICTSEAVKGAVVTVLAAQADFLAERLGAMRAPLPRLPVIPLGVHPADFAVTDAERGEARAGMGLDADAVAILFVGRLSTYSKGHPAPMYLALEAAAAARARAGHAGQIVLIEVGWFESDEVRDAYAADARALSPSVRRIALDGRDAAARRRGWASADVFTSLADSIQESFGLTPVEAMAAGLPVVVSDWNGYRETVRDGIDGFRIPTFALSPGMGQMIADRYGFGIDDYAGYLATVGRCVSVDVEAAAAAYAHLAANPALRRRMGEAGRARVAAEFDWSRVFGRYRSLWGELAEVRRAAAGSGLPKRRVRPDRPDPFAMFAGYPTAALGPGTLVRRVAGADVDEALRRRGLETMRLTQPLLPSADLIARILDGLGTDGWRSFDALRRRLGRPALELAPAVLWLAKLGILALQPPRGGTDAGRPG